MEPDASLPDSKLVTAYRALQSGNVALARALLKDPHAIDDDHVGAFALAPHLSTERRVIEASPQAVAQALRASTSAPAFAASVAGVCLALWALLAVFASFYR
jgi:beta-lactamase regulating signal transducer with metallopeptidase domain